MNRYTTDLFSSYNLLEVLQRSKLDPPKKYSYLPATFMKRVQEPENFIPSKMAKHFNEIMFFNTLHRSCFNSCVNKEDTKTCYKNCQSKHLTSIELFKTAIEEDRKWNKITSFINVREYQKRPQELLKNTLSDTDYSKKSKYLIDQFVTETKLNANNLNDVFSSAVKQIHPLKTNIFSLYFQGMFPHYTRKAIERSGVANRYEEYKQLLEQYESQVKSELEKRESEFSWGSVNGEDYEGSD